MHSPVPEQAPLQPANVESPFADAMSVTTVLRLNGAEHVPPQLIPGGDDDTVPDPVPGLLIDRVNVGIAVTVNGNVPDFCVKPLDTPVHPTFVVPVAADTVAL